MGHICHVTGARPNFPKAAPVLAALAKRGAEQRLVHTGQHYDDNLSTIFFRELGLPTPDDNLGVGSGSHAEQTATIMTRFEQVVLRDRPDLVVVYGDVNSTVAATLVAVKLGIPVAHVEAGLRSFDRSMPEEVNRVVTDRLSDVLLVTSPEALANLASEGADRQTMHFVGNPMIDTLLKHLEATGPAVVRKTLDLPETYAVATLHRPANVDSPNALADLVEALDEVADLIPVVIPVHPRGRAAMEGAGLFQNPSIIATDPLGYIDFLSLVRGSALVVTDSGGIQEETTILGVPCFTMRPNTERPVTIKHGTNRLTTTKELPALVAVQVAATNHRSYPTPPLWDGKSGERIADILQTFLEARSLH